MIAQALLTLGLLIFAGYALTSPFLGAVTKLFLLFVPLVGIALVWHPEAANAIAGVVGIGRGADLLLYCWVIISLLMGFVLNARIHFLHRELTDLARAVALKDAESPSFEKFVNDDISRSLPDEKNA